MSELLLRWLPGGGSEWLAADGRVQSGLPRADADQRVTVLVPGEDVLLLDLPRIAGSAAQLQQALPFAIEEQLAAPVEQQHVAWAANGERLRVAVVARERIEQWLAALRDAGVEPDAMIPETLALQPGARPQLLVEDGRCLLRLDDARGLMLERATVAELAAQIPQPVDCWLAGSDAAPLPVHSQQAVAQVLPLLASGAQGSPLNLLQGRYAPRRRVGGAQRAWRWAAMLAAAVLASLLLTAVVDQRKLSAKVAAQEAEMAALYLRAVPGASNADNPAQQLQAVLSSQGLGDGDPALSLLSLAAPAIAADARISLDALDYRDGRLELVLQAADVAGLDALRQRLAAAGLAVEIVASTPGSQGVQGRLRIGGRR
ncbi:MAG TPA: type II secretion system protein GspL [Arenimonas sp.]|nr:type II secretion system protein GspL [Arenimonas sp.]